MTTQNYLMVENNVVTNNVVWDGNTATWNPPTGATMLIDADTYGQVWEPVWDTTQTPPVIIDYELVSILGVGDIGFTWNGTEVVTNQPKPEIPTQS